MNTDPDERTVEDAAGEILKPIDDLIAKEAEEMKEADEIIGAAEAKARKIIVPAKRIVEE